MMQKLTIGLYFIFGVIMVIFIGIYAIYHEEVQEVKTPTVFVVISGKNLEHCLPNFLAKFMELDYPKDKMGLYIHSEYNDDYTTELFEYWLSEYKTEYMNVIKRLKSFSSQLHEGLDWESWENKRNVSIIRRKEEALKLARRKNYDFIWFLDGRVVLQNTGFLRKLMKERKTIVAPLLNSVNNKANFWDSMTKSLSDQRSCNYYRIINNKKLGCFPVSLVSKAVLINLRYRDSQNLSFLKPNISKYYFDVEIPNVDTIIFSLNAMLLNVPSYICNRQTYGDFLIIDHAHSQREDRDQLIKLGYEISDDKYENINKRISTEGFPVQVSDKLTFDRVYCINLKRRPDRRHEMLSRIRQLEIEPSIFTAVDWKDFNISYLNSINVKQLESYDQMDLTYGVAAQFLSHYYVWKDVIERNYKQVIVLEDDVKFHENFTQKLIDLGDELDRLKLNWDKIYLGRRILRSHEEKLVNDSKILARPSYSWWSIGYAISQEGARKLVNQDPMNRLLPLDEYFPIMFDKHPVGKWKMHFYPRDLKTFAIYPSIVEPHKYFNDDGYNSDTTYLKSFADIQHRQEL